MQKETKADIISRMETIAGDVCIPNISTKERRRRLISAGVMLLIGLAVWALLITSGANHWWRIALFPLLAGAASGFFQWRDKT